MGEDVNGHVIEGSEKTARGIFEGNVFIKVKQLVSDYQGRLFSSQDATTNAQCESALGRACEVNVLEETTDDFVYTDTSFFGDFKGLSIASADAADKIKSTVPSNAGAGKLSSSSSLSKSSTKAISEEAAEPAETTAATPVVSATTSKPKPTAASSGSGSGSVPLYGQCGGQGYSGSTSCSSGKCEFINEWYSQCV